MKLPSIQLLTQAFIKVLKRFPMVLASALLGTVVSIILAEGNYAHLTELKLLKLAMVSSLGLPLFFAVHMFCEKWNAKPIFTFTALLTALFLLVQFYFSISALQEQNAQLVFRFLFWSAGLHLLASFAAFFVADELNGFWQFNKLLFLRFLNAALYSGVLYLGLAGAILAVDELFNLHIDHDLYVDLWLVIAGLFNTVFFLGGIQEPVVDLNNEHNYPKGLKIFTQYVLLPLVTVYLVILYAYLAKIIVQQNLPQGWVANLILGFSVTGILSLLLVWPLREQEENKWVKTFARFFYFSLLPLLALLFIAIGTRINAYGVTVERYIVAMLGVWLALITLYFIFSKRKNIILIPLTLALFLFGSCFGPWGMFAVAERSQVKRLKILLEKNHMLVNGKVVKLASSDLALATTNDLQQIQSIINYLSQEQSLQVIGQWLNDDCRKKVFDSSLENSSYEQVNNLESCLGIYGISYDRGNDRKIDFSFNSRDFNNLDGLTISGYDRIYDFYARDDNDMVKDSSYRLVRNQMIFYNDKQRVFTYTLDTTVEKLRRLSLTHESHNVPATDMTCELDGNAGYRIKILFTDITGYVTDSAAKVTYVRAYVLVGDK
jgi:hypothetical protein